MQSNFYDTAFKFRNYFDTTLNAYFFMKELIDRIMANAQITGPQAEKALETVKDFVKEKKATLFRLPLRYFHLRLPYYQFFRKCLFAVGNA